MRSRWMLLPALMVSAWFAGSDLVLGQSARDVAPPWKPFVACTATAFDGQSVAVMLTPGSSTGSWVVIVGGSAAWQIAPLDSTVIPTPDPTPPTPSPSLEEEAKKTAVDAAQKLTAEGRQEDAQKLSAVYRTLAGQIPKPIDSIDKLIAANRYAREIVLEPKRAQAWEPWVKEMGTWLDAKRTAGAVKTVDDCKKVWTAIADGLAELKGTGRQ